jgi:dipeptidyl aminopeptidase/acylaminoacyl peptidase
MIRLRALPASIVLAIVLLGALGAGTASATIAFVRNPFHPAVFAANDTGKGIHRIGLGYSPHVSPDGNSVVYFQEGKSPAMAIAPAAGGKSRTLMSGWREPYFFAYSPDSKSVAALRGPELGKQKLVVIDVATGRQTVISQGYFNGISFSPDGSEIVFSKTAKSYSLSGDVFRAPAGGGKVVALTRDHHSVTPLWGPDNRIVFDKVRNLKSDVGPKGDLYLMNPDGSAVKRLTKTKIAPLLFGLSAVAWSASGDRLLAQFSGQDTSYAVTVNPKTGRERQVVPGDFEQGFIGDGLSKDGTLVLGTTNGAEPGPNHQVATVPYSGGKIKVLIPDAYEASWSR